MSESEYERQLVALLANDELGLQNWIAELDPILMEKWANRFDMKGIPAEREDILELVYNISKLSFIPLNPVWEQVYAKEGIAPVVWVVGAENGKRVIKFKIKKDYIPEDFGVTNMKILTSELALPLKAEVEFSEPEDELMVTFRW